MSYIDRHFPRLRNVGRHSTGLVVGSLLLLGLSIPAVSNAETVAAGAAAVTAAERNAAAGWKVPDSPDGRGRVSARNVDEFVQITGTKAPVESKTPLTKAEIEALANKPVTVQESAQVAPEVAAGVLAEAAAPAAREYDYFTWDECRSKGDNVSVGKNHFAWCFVKPIYYDYYLVDVKTGERIWAGEIKFRVTVLGRGVRGSQHMSFDMQADAWEPIFGVVPPSAKLGVRLNCLAGASGVCESSNTVGREDTIAGWMVNAGYSVQFDASQSPGGGDLTHFDIDKVSYHDLEIILTDDEGPKYSTQQAFRCDAAPYANHGACIFHEVAAVLHYRVNSNSREVAEHIKSAQDEPDTTYPFGEGAVIPGKPGTKPLTRLYANRNYVDSRLVGGSVNALAYYRRNRAIVRNACRRLARSSSPGALVKKECDEYPFASTYDGAYFTELTEGSIYKYSVRYVDGNQNNKAGRELQDWYMADHIIARDLFHVQIDP
jgi:hypothetical protein